MLANSSVDFDTQASSPLFNSTVTRLWTVVSPGMIGGRVMAEWASWQSYTSRVNNIKGTGSGPRFNESYYLQPGTTVFDDGASDVLTGSAGRDWFLVNLFQDAVTDQEPDDVLTE
ncbi:MAG: hypothetical protein HY674_06845 [Chloroflexi bacterium]|nr:hypothetical protein [Chloroflexota bacterium]